MDPDSIPTRSTCLPEQSFYSRYFQYMSIGASCIKPVKQQDMLLYWFNILNDRVILKLC
jgi:hypothetical protein